MKKIIVALSVALTLNVYAGTSTIETLATKNGVKKCSPQLKIVGEYIVDDRPHATHSSWNKNDPDNRLYASLTSKGYSDGDSHVTVIASPTSSGKCDATYIETFALATSCMLAREETYKDWKYVGTLNMKTLMLENESGSVNVYLSAQGANDNICLISKREVVYQ